MQTSLRRSELIDIAQDSSTVCGNGMQVFRHLKKQGVYTMSSLRTDIQQTKVTLVLGGTGKTGRRVVERLTARGVPTRVGSRSGEPAFDWEDQTTWAPILRDVASVYITYYPDLAVPGAAATIRSFTDLAVQSGVQRLVLLSGRGEEEAQRCEQVVRDETRGPIGRSCGRAGSARTSARASCKSWCAMERSHSRLGMWPSRSSTRRILRMWPSQH